MMTNHQGGKDGHHHVFIHIFQVVWQGVDSSTSSSGQANRELAIGQIVVTDQLEVHGARADGFDHMEHSVPVGKVAIAERIHDDTTIAFIEPVVGPLEDLGVFDSPVPATNELEDLQGVGSHHLEAQAQHVDSVAILNVLGT